MKSESWNFTAKKVFIVENIIAKTDDFKTVEFMDGNTDDFKTTVVL